MGESVSKFFSYIKTQSIANNVKDLINRKRKRVDEEDDSEEESNLVLEKIMHTPKRKKLICTSEYIFQALFQEGKGSDVTVNILGKSWLLHKIYLAQSPYFSSMFCGSWKEAAQDTIDIEVIDPNVTLESLSTVLGSLYLDKMTIEPANCISILATAAVFQLEGIIDQCVEVMVETVNVKTVIGYYNAGKLYSLRKVSDSAYKWLLVNLMAYMCDKPDRLKEITSLELMTALVSSPDLFVMQIEFSVYCMLRYWMYLQVEPVTSSVETSQKYFSERQDDEAFLRTEAGRRFAPVFRCLRLHHLVNHHVDIETMRSDRVIPEEWLGGPVTEQWCQMLRLDHGMDKGPRAASNQDFMEHGMRCGRILKTDAENVWRWTGYNFGLDLVWTVSGRCLKVRRNHRHDNPGEILLSQQSRRHVMMRVTLASLDEQRQVKHCQGTGIRAVSFCKNQEVVLLCFDEELTFPLHISVNLLVTSMLSASAEAAREKPETVHNVPTPIIFRT